MKWLLRLILGVGVVSSVATALITGYMVQFLRQQGMLDLPGERRSHSAPTPRGGGASIALVTLGAAVVSGAARLMPWQLVLGFVLGGGIVATVGWLDDRYGLPVLPRMGAHLVAALLLVWSAGGVPRIHLGTTVVYLGNAGSILGVLGVMWAINLYNFMDGIDGLAASQAVMVALPGGLILLLAGAQGLALVGFAIAGASAGFLLWNWSPAKVFMGDVSSGLLGFEFAALAIMGEKAGEPSILIWSMLLGVFIVDATATLVWRIIRKQSWHQPHREHAYQLAVQRGYSHQHVTLFAVGIDVLLGAAAFVAHSWPHVSLGVFSLSFVGLMAGWVWVKPEPYLRGLTRGVSSGL